MQAALADRAVDTQEGAVEAQEGAVAGGGIAVPTRSRCETRSATHYKAVALIAVAVVVDAFAVADTLVDGVAFVAVAGAAAVAPLVARATSTYFVKNSFRHYAYPLHLPCFD